MSGVNLQGTQVFGFKHPGPEELTHDFLWNAERRLPERGRIGIFNRSYYEEVLIVRVHSELLTPKGVRICRGGLWIPTPDFLNFFYDALCRINRILK